MSKTYICIKSIFLSILSKGFEGKGFEGKGERILEGTSVIFLDKNTIRKKNGSRIYKIDNPLNYFIEESRLKYKGVDSSLFNLKRNKEYLYGGKVLNSIDSITVHRIFLKRFPEADFLELTNEEFTIYFNNSNLTLNNFNILKETSLNYLNKNINLLTEKLGNRVNATVFYNHQDYWESKKLKEFKERKSLLISISYDKIK